MDKATIRANLLKRRRGLAVSERLRASVAVLNQLQSDQQFIHPNYPEVVGLYVPVKGELDTRPLYEWFKIMGKTIAFPKTNGDSCTFHISSWEQLEPGPFRILEPCNGPAIEPDWVFVPGIAVGKNGHRIGFGHGFFDRTLAKLKKTVRIGSAYDFQVLDSVPEEPWDQRLDYILSESELFVP